MKCGHFLTSCLAGIPRGIHIQTRTWTHVSDYKWCCSSDHVDILYFDFERNLEDVLELSDYICGN